MLRPLPPRIGLILTFNKKRKGPAVKSTVHPKGKAWKKQAILPK